MDEELDPIARGIWCHSCEFFEDELGTPAIVDKCESCGCSRSMHSDVKVVPN